MLRPDRADPAVFQFWTAMWRASVPATLDDRDHSALQRPLTGYFKHCSTATTEFRGGRVRRTATRAVTRRPEGRLYRRLCERSSFDSCLPCGNRCANSAQYQSGQEAEEKDPRHDSTRIVEETEWVLEVLHGHPNHATYDPQHTNGLQKSSHLFLRLSDVRVSLRYYARQRDSERVRLLLPNA
jgi:hypothetical protein